MYVAREKDQHHSGAGQAASCDPPCVQNNPDMMKQAMDMMASMPPEQMENLRRMATGAGGQAGR